MTTYEQDPWAPGVKIPADSIMITELSIGGRALNAFRRHGIKTVADIIEHEAKDLTDMRGFGPHCLAETIEALREVGYELKAIDYAARR